MPKKKTPALSQQPSGAKIPIVKENPEFYKNLKPTWSFCRCDKEHDSWSICKCEDLWNKVIGKLGDLESQTWAEIMQSAGHRRHGTNNHHIAVEELAKEAQQRLVQLHLDQLETVFSIALDGKTRIIGILEGSVFKLLWWDPDHEVCASTKRHS